MYNVCCAKTFSGGRILLLLIIHEDGAINESEGTPSSFLWFSRVYTILEIIYQGQSFQSSR
jgi:hypothetical protein